MTVTLLIPQITMVHPLQTIQEKQKLSTMIRMISTHTYVFQHSIDYIIDISGFCLEEYMLGYLCPGIQI